MTTPGPLPLRDVARRMHRPEADVRRATSELCKHWGDKRVIAIADGVTIRLTPAAVIAIHQAFGLAHLNRPQRRSS